MASVSAQATKTVLVADDTAFVRDKFRHAIEHAGHRVILARSGPELLAAVHRDQPRIDLILLDLHLSGARGIELLRRTRAIAQDRPLLVFSGTIASEREVAEMTPFSVSGYINEYIGPQHLLPALAPHLFPEAYNRRASPRVILNTQVSYRIGNAIATALCINVSTGGIAVRTTNPLAVDTRVKVRFRLPKLGHDVEADARVAWGAPSVGMGLQFTRIDAKDRDAIESYVNAHFFSNRRT
jgi:uncharacterized protein (TIGR02266 family)